MQQQQPAQHPIYMTTMSAGTNIAVIKYWGKADENYNTPINSSVSCTLDQRDLRAVTTVAASFQFDKDRLWLNGVEDLKAADNPRFRACIDGVKALATDQQVEVVTNNSNENKTEKSVVNVTKSDWQKMRVHVSSYNTFPTAAGLASSAAGYAALVAALARLVQAREEFPHQLTTIARQGSGSACRSLYGGCVAWRRGNPPDWLDSLAEPVVDVAEPQDEQYWPELRAVIAVVSDAQKDTSSTSGMRTSVETSTLLPHRAAVIVPERMSQLEAAYVARDFETFGKLTMQDSNQFHAVCLDTYPPIFYLNDTSRAIIRMITAYNAYKKKICAAYTFDAGPNAVIYCLQAHSVEIGALLRHYFPPADSSSSIAAYNNYVANNAEYASQIQEYTLSNELLTALSDQSMVCHPGQVKKLYYTRQGPGPQVVTDVCNLDPVTGLNVYQPPSTSTESE